MDAKTEGEWHWLDGDEESEQFWSGNQNGSVIPGSYHNWDPDEPNADWSEANIHIANYIIEWDAAEVVANTNITFALSNTAGDRFTIDPDTGEITVDDGTQLDFETDIEHDVTVDADYGAYVTSEIYTIDVNDINDAPILDAPANYIVTPVAEDETAPTGETVANILASEGLDRITDVDIGAVEGIAVYTVDDTNGVWQYSLAGSGTWNAFGAVDTASALLLDPDAMIRFVPANDFTGTSEFFFHAWDQTQGTIGQNFDITSTGTGGSTAFSISSDVARINITPVNDDPVIGGFKETWLADLTPQTLTNTIGFDDNAGHLNAQIRLDGQEFFHGIGVHPDTGVAVVEYDLNGATNFSAIVGVNDRLFKGGEVIFRAYVDGVEEFNSGIMTTNTPAMPVSIDTSGGSLLRLEVDSAGPKTIDHAVWSNAKQQPTARWLELTLAVIPTPAIH